MNLGKTQSGEPVDIDLEVLLKTRLLVTASSGGGKSETLRRILEEFVGKVQCIVIDPEGEFSTLREKYPFVLVGEGGETPADIRTAALVATRLLELNASAVCDLYELKVHERHEWVKRFIDAIVSSPKSLWHPVLIIIDEAHMFAPESGYGNSVALQSIIDLCNLGRKRQFCPIIATQRLSKLNKNVVEPLQNYLVGRTTYDDQARAAATFKVAGAAAVRDFSLELERLKDGEFFQRGRAFNGDMLKVQVTRAHTKPPAIGSAMVGTITPTPSAIKALLPKLSDLPHEVEKKQKTEEDLRVEIRELKLQVKNLSQQGITPEREKMLVEQVKQLHERAKAYESTLDKISKSATSMVSAAQEIQSSIEALRGLPETTFDSVAPLRTPRPVVAAVRQAAPSKRESVANDGEKVSGPEQKVLNSLAWFKAIGVPEPESSAVAFMAGYTVNGSYNNACGKLNTRGLIRYLSNGCRSITEAGELLAEIPAIELSNEALHEAVLSKLDGPSQKVLVPLLESYPKSIDSASLAEKAGYTENGSFFNARGRLKSFGLIDYPGKGESVARDILFPEGA